MKILLSVVVAAVAFGALVVAGPQRMTTDQDDMMPPPHRHGGPNKHVKMLMLFSCLCGGDFSNCTMADTFFNCTKADMTFLGNVTDMSPCDVEMKLKENTESCFGEKGSMMEPIMTCKKKMKEKKMEMIAKMGPTADEMFKSCTATGGSKEEN